MITRTNSTKPFPWKAIAKLMGVTLVMSAKATWWLAKHGAAILGAIFGFLFVVIKATSEVFLDDEDGERSDPAKNIRVSGIDHLEDDDGYNHRQNKFLM